MIATATTDWIAAVAAVAGAFAAAVGLAYAGLQLRAARQSADGARLEARSARKVTESEFLLALEDQFRRHWEVHIALRPGGKWAGPGQGPQSNEDLAQVESYMGLFERLNILHSNDVLPLPYIEKFYRYRLGNLWANDVIRDTKIDAYADSWKDFIELSHKLKISLSDPVWARLSAGASEEPDADV